jgi:hypothetical protein
MNKFLIGITIWLFGFSVFSQIKSNEADTQLFVFPMKGDFIHYSLSHTMSNTKQDLMYYLNMSNSDFYKNFGTKSISLAFSFSAFKKQTRCNISPPSAGGNGNLKLTLPTGVSLLDGNLLFELITFKKFKIYGESVDATIKLELSENNSYTLIFTNFLITYNGKEGGAFKTVTLDLEDVYNEIKQKQSLDGKMYDRSAKNLMEIDKFVHIVDELFYTELDKVIRMDN